MEHRNLWVATFAMAGDLFSSFVKRKLHLASSSMAIGLGAHPGVFLLPLCQPAAAAVEHARYCGGGDNLRRGWTNLSPILFKLNLRDEPH